MKLHQTKINTPLMLDDVIFKDNANNIDFLLSEAAKDISFYSRLDLLNLAVKKVEKFHSFFHFEQSHFHTQFAIFLKSKGDEVYALEEFEKALFQDHLNVQAKEFISFGYSDVKYGRVFDNFIDYIMFATDEPFHQVNPCGYWSFFSYSFKEIIEDIKSRHLLYHNEAAKIYYNRAMVFHALGEYSLSRNDIVKAENLNPQILSLV
jgi:tetratricopeptide (TPR) repeat protein